MGDISVSRAGSTMPVSSRALRSTLFYLIGRLKLARLQRSDEHFEGLDKHLALVWQVKIADSSETVHGREIRV